MGAKRVSKQGVTVSEGNAIEVTNAAGTALFSVNSTGNINTLANLTAKGSILTASAANTPAALAVGNAGETLVADSSASTGLRWQGTYAAGKNLVINGGFDIWQRGTSFTTTTYGLYSADRWLQGTDGSGVTKTVSQQTFTPGSAPVAGYEAQYFHRINQSVAGTGAGYNVLDQRIEDVRIGAGQTITLSFWAKTASAKNITIQYAQSFGTGGSGDVVTTVVSGQTIGTSWTRYTFTTALPSISGKTIGTNSFLLLRFSLPTNDTFTFDLWGVQLEVGSVATAFTRAGGTLAGELAACQRYYFRVVSGAVYTPLTAGGFSNSATSALGFTPFPVEMRIAPTALEQSGTANQYGINESGSGFTCSAVPVFNSATKVGAGTTFTFASGLTVGRGAWGRSDNNTTAYLAWSAEL